VVRLTPITAKKPVLGSARGTVTYNDGWDAPMTAEELAEFEDGPVFPK
jgi:hypothetical protein